MIIDALKVAGNDIDSAIERMAGSERLFCKFINMFPNDKSMDELTVAVAEQDAKKALSAVHTLKGVSANLGLTKLFEICSTMVIKFRAEDFENAFACFDEVKKQYDEIICIINKGE